MNTVLIVDQESEDGGEGMIYTVGAKKLVRQSNWKMWQTYASILLALLAAFFIWIGVLSGRYFGGIALLLLSIIPFFVALNAVLALMLDAEVVAPLTIICYCLMLLSAGWISFFIKYPNIGTCM